MLLVSKKNNELYDNWKEPSVEVNALHEASRITVMRGCFLSYLPFLHLVQDSSEIPLKDIHKI